MTIMNQVEIKAKMMALQDAIASALKNKTFEKELDVLKIQAAELNLSDAEFNTLVEQAKKTLTNQQTVAIFVGNHKKTILSVLGALVGLEWIIPILCGWKCASIQSSATWALPIGWGWILVINFVTILLLVVLLSVYINIKNKKH